MQRVKELMKHTCFYTDNLAFNVSVYENREIFKVHQDILQNAKVMLEIMFVNCCARNHIMLVQKAGILFLFVYVDTLHPSQHFFSHVVMIFCHPGLNQYLYKQLKNSFKQRPITPS